MPAGVYLSGLSASVSPRSLLGELTRVLPSMGDLAAGSVGVRRVAGEAALLVHPAFASEEFLRRLSAELGRGCAVRTTAGPVRVQIAKSALRRIADGDAAAAPAPAAAAEAPGVGAGALIERPPELQPDDAAAPAAPDGQRRKKRGGRLPKAKRAKKPAPASR